MTRVITHAPPELKEWIIQKYVKGGTYIDVTSRTELMTRSEMLLKLEAFEKAFDAEFRGHNVVNHAKRGLL